MNDFLGWLMATQQAVIKVIVRNSDSIDPNVQESCRDLLQGQWEMAASVWRRYGDRSLIESMVKNGYSPPVDVAQAIFLEPQPRRGRPPKVGTDAETVVKLVRMASLLGHPFRGGDANANPAFVQVARLIGCHPEHVARIYKLVPRGRREELRLRARWVHEQLRIDGGT